MTEVLPALIQRDSDFFQYQGQWIDGACPATSLANVASSATGKRITPESVYLLMRAHGLCAANGAATIAGVRTAALLLGLEIADYRPYAEPWPDWEAWVSTQALAGNVLVLETAYGQALKDSMTGEGENYVNSLLYHFFGGVAWLTDGTSAYAEKTFNKLVTGPGLWSVDGDNWAFDNGIEWDFNCGDVPQFYSAAVLGAARLCAGLSIVVKKAAPTVWTKQSDGTGKDSAGHVCSAGFMGNLEANSADLESDGLANSTALPNGTAFLPLANGTLWIADPVAAPFKRFALPGLAQEYMKLYALLKAAEEKPAPPAPPIPAEYTAALAAVKALQPAMSALQAAEAALSTKSAVATVTVSGGSLSDPSDTSSFVVTNVE